VTVIWHLAYEVDDEKRRKVVLVADRSASTSSSA
jgi:hypothetical protein